MAVSGNRTATAMLILLAFAGGGAAITVRDVHQWSQNISQYLSRDLMQGKMKMEGKMKGLAQGKEGPKGGVAPIPLRKALGGQDDDGGQDEENDDGYESGPGFDPTTPWTARL